MSKYTVYQGKFSCHQCKMPVGSLRLYAEDKLMTWMCRDKHLSTVSLNTKKKKVDYERAR